MALLTVVWFPSAEGARPVLTTLEDLQRQQLITIHDAVIVQWPPDRKRPRTEMELSATNLSKEEEDTLRTAFEHE